MYGFLGRKGVVSQTEKPDHFGRRGRFPAASSHEYGQRAAWCVSQQFGCCTASQGGKLHQTGVAAEMRGLMDLHPAAHGGPCGVGNITLRMSGGEQQQRGYEKPLEAVVCEFIDRLIDRRLGQFQKAGTRRQLDSLGYQRTDLKKLRPADPIARTVAD